MHYAKTVQFTGLILTLLWASCLNGQLFGFHNDRDLLPDNPLVGFNLGYSFYSISGFEGTLGASLSEAGTYTYTEGKIGAMDIGISVMAPISPGYIFAQMDVDYSIPAPPEDEFSRGHGLYEDGNGLQYAFNAAYQRVHLRPAFGIFLFKFFSVKTGIDWGINTTPRELRYTSNDPTIGRDLAIRDELATKLEGRNSLGLLVAPEIQIIIEDFNTMLTFGATYSYGFTDVVRTSANNFRLQETTNRLTNMSLHFSGKFLIRN